MKFLAFDTSEIVILIALSENGKWVGECCMSVDKIDYNGLILLLNQLLKTVSWKWNDLDFIGVLYGPGSIHIIKLGLSIAHRIAEDNQIPIVGLQSFEALTLLEHDQDLLRKLGSKVRILPVHTRGCDVVQAVWHQWCKRGPEEIAIPYDLSDEDYQPKEAEIWKEEINSEQSRFTEDITKSAVVCFMREEDLKEVMKIEMRSFPSPWSPLAFVTELRYNEDACYFCLKLNGKVIGYLGLWIRLDEGHITHIAIAPDYLGHRWGTYLMHFVMADMLKKGMKHLQLEVRSSNQTAINFYQRLGFVQAEINKDYYSNPSEDAICMWLDLGFSIN